MKHKVIGYIGLLLLVLGVTLVIVQLVSGDKPIIKSIAGGASTIMWGSILIGVSSRMERKKRESGDSSDTPKG